jgi:hypothetical protein
MAMTLEKIKEMNIPTGTPIEITVNKVTNRETLNYQYVGYFSYVSGDVFAYARRKSKFMNNLKFKKISNIESITILEPKK